jgi:hypothetical protein
MTEVWKAVPGYDGYEVSDMGRVRSVPRTILTASGPRRIAGHLLTPGLRRIGGRPAVFLSQNGQQKSITVHRLGACPPGMQACHWNDDPDDDRLVNLRWDTPAANRRDAARNNRLGHGTYPRAVRFPSPLLARKLTDEQVASIRSATGSGKELALQFGVSESMISRIRSGQRRTM